MIQKSRKLFTIIRQQYHKYDAKQQARFYECFKKLQKRDQYQWLQQMILKCYACYFKNEFQLLKSQLYFLVEVCDKNELELQSDQLQDLLKKAFLEIDSKNRMKKIFDECGINTDEDVLYYEQQGAFMDKFRRFFCF